MAKPPLLVRALQPVWVAEGYRDTGTVYLDPRGVAFPGITEAVNPPAEAPAARSEPVVETPRARAGRRPLRLPVDVPDDDTADA